MFERDVLKVDLIGAMTTGAGNTPENDPLPTDDLGGAQSAEAQAERADEDPLTTAQRERDAWRDQVLRTRAEMENMRKRLNREREEERRYAALPLIRDLLPALDNLRRAVDAGQAGAQSAGSAPGDAAANLLTGVSMVLKQCDELLTRHGAEVISAEPGAPFDPHLHEALQQLPTTDFPPGSVLQEWERGYRLHDRVIRPSKVIVASAAPTAP